MIHFSGVVFMLIPGDWWTLHVCCASGRGQVSAVVPSPVQRTCHPCWGRQGNELIKAECNPTSDSMSWISSGGISGQEGWGEERRIGRYVA